MLTLCQESHIFCFSVFTYWIITATLWDRCSNFPIYILYFCRVVFLLKLICNVKTNRGHVFGGVFRQTHRGGKLDLPKSHAHTPSTHHWVYLRGCPAYLFRVSCYRLGLLQLYPMRFSFSPEIAMQARTARDTSYPLCTLDCELILVFTHTNINCLQIF